MKYDEGYDLTLSKAYRAAHCVAEANGASFTLSMSEYGHLLREAGYETYYEDGRTKLHNTGMQVDVYRRYFRGSRR
ncbi:hypothetical protein ACFYPC_11185 [Streptomyces sp. NPDC005808]|uniref:hypothetical protein n=1 Tax=Streptomyces sp. NPDC005808 TaxID=3364734 RepID=UPI00367CF1BB